ncbi:hypothetical protein FDUTEX481_00848 [Tolypothrix sp. PCC 7601]|nr:hypothetical protein FDUTEX481_00848 [Tolypothrix sp. PCC 7601]
MRFRERATRELSRQLVLEFKVFPIRDSEQFFKVNLDKVCSCF